jgi:two-component sensor histidine kinase
MPSNFERLLRGVHAEDRAAVSSAFERAALPGGDSVLTMEYRAASPGIGTERWVALNGRAHVAPGEDARIAGTVRDVTKRRRAEEQRRLLVNELDHRVKNTLATIQSIARQTLTGVTDLDGRRAFEGRLLALSQAHNVLTREHWGSARLHDIVANTFEPYGTPADGTFRVHGPNIRLSPRAALALALALHELATNAAKYGALSVPDGRVGVRWKLDSPDLPSKLCLAWAEAGGPRVQPPRRKGFGSRLIERGLSMEIDGKVKLDFNARGVRCRIEVPLTALGGAHD